MLDSAKRRRRALIIFRGDPLSTSIDATLMRPAIFIPYVVVVFLLAGCRSEPEFVPLFNGRDLSGWKNVNGAPSTWTVNDGMIACSGIPTGVLCTGRHYENYVLELEWRHMREGGNAGLFVHSDPLPARGQPFTRSTECQIMDGNHGDVFAIHGATMVPDHPHPEGWMRSLPTEKRARPTGEWNHYRVESRDGRLALAVNGKIVSGGSELTPRKGYICLESEGSEVHFRNIRIQELPSTEPSPEETADVYRGFTTLYNGVDLAGWRTASRAPWQADDWILRNTSTGGGEQLNRTGDSADGVHLWTEKSYGDFELIADWRVECESDSAAMMRSGIFLRGSTDAMVFLGCESATSDDITIGRAFADETASSRGWHRLSITARGRDVTVEFDGTPIADQQLPPGVPALGAIGLVDDGAPVQFANLFIRELE